MGLGTTDEECNFETYQPICEPGERSGCATASDYVRNALKAGLRLEADYGVIRSNSASSPARTTTRAWPCRRRGRIRNQAGQIRHQRGIGSGMLGRGADSGPAWFGDRPDGGNANNPAAWSAYGPRPTPATPSSTRCAAARPSATAVRASTCASSPAGTTRRPRHPARHAGGGLRRRRADGLGSSGSTRGQHGRRPPLRRLGHEGPRQRDLQKIQIVKGWARPANPRRRSPLRAFRRPSRYTTSSVPTGFSPTRDAPLRGQRRRGGPFRLQLLHRAGRGRAEHHLDGPGFRPRAAGVLLRARAGNPPAAGRPTGRSRAEWRRLHPTRPR